LSEAEHIIERGGEEEGVGADEGKGISTEKKISMLPKEQELIPEY
jgi:hypothetical protein